MSSFAIRIGRRPRRHAFRCVMLGGIVCGALAGASAALAQSGEVAGTEGVFQIPTEDCEQLRDLSDGSEGSTTGTEVQGDIVVVCDGGDGTGRRICEVLSGSTTAGTSAGQGIGFCADSFPNGVRLVEDGPLKEGVDVLATSFGGITGTTEPGEPPALADTVCETFAPSGESLAGTKVCRRVIASNAGSDECTDGFIVTPTSAPANAQACALVAGELEGAVTALSPNNLSFALFIDIDTLGKPGSEALFVCPGRRLECGRLDEVPSAVDVDYQIPKVVVREDPDCIRIRGRRFC